MVIFRKGVALDMGVIDGLTSKHQKMDLEQDGKILRQFAKTMVVFSIEYVYSYNTGVIILIKKLKQNISLKYILGSTNMLWIDSSDHVWTS